MSKRLLAFIAVVGIPIYGCDVNHPSQNTSQPSQNTSQPSENANRLSENDACRMATDKAKKDFDNNYYFQNNIFHDYKFLPCTDFSSISEQGVAQIVLPFSYHGASNELVSQQRTVYFYRTDQGWKIRP